jgi:hypothetical protein
MRSSPSAAALAVLALLAGCATPPGRIQAKPVTDNRFANLDCPMLISERDRRTTIRDLLEDAQGERLRADFISGALTGLTQSMVFSPKAREARIAEVKEKSTRSMVRSQRKNAKSGLVEFDSDEGPDQVKGPWRLQSRGSPFRSRARRPDFSLSARFPRWLGHAAQSGWLNGLEHVMAQWLWDAGRGSLTSRWGQGSILPVRFRSRFTLGNPAAAFSPRRFRTRSINGGVYAPFHPQDFS